MNARAEQLVDVRAAWSQNTASPPSFEIVQFVVEQSRGGGDGLTDRGLAAEAATPLLASQAR